MSDYDSACDLAIVCNADTGEIEGGVNALPIPSEVNSAENAVQGGIATNQR